MSDNPGITLPAVDATPIAGETYLRAFSLPADTASNTLSGDHRLYTGVFQVNIVAPSGKYPIKRPVCFPEYGFLQKTLGNSL
jgi:hypothetical protein